MGAWGIKTFENDGALDWLNGFLNEPSEKKLLDTFSAKAPTIQPGILGKLFGKKPSNIPTEINGEEVLATAEIVAAIKGLLAEPPLEELENLPKISLSPDTPAAALAAIDNITNGSNLKECWEETDDFEPWKAEVNNLRKRLSE